MPFKRPSSCGASLPGAGVLTVLAFLFVLVPSCRAQKMDTVVLEISGQHLTVEVASTPAEREIGLMNRKKMDENHGMLFVFTNEEKLSFWMKNTHIPLSIAFISADGTIKQIENMVPFSLEPVVSRRSVLYALEVNRGWFSRHGIAVGDKVILPESFER